MFTRLFRKKIYLLENSLVVFILISLLLPVIHSIPLSARQSESAKHPGARWGHALVYDPVRNEIVLFGGSRERGVYLDDTWTWDGKSWHHRNVVGPRSRGFAAVAFHEAKDTVIIHGGRGSGRSTYSDTWEWDGESWQNIEKEGPYRSDHHQMVYVADDNQLLAFGGWNGHDVAGETWLWDGEWKKTEVEGPHKRAAFAMAYDAHRASTILFGGLWLDGQYADVWEWHDGSWHSRGGPYDNSSLDHHAMSYDITRQQLIIFGGKNYRSRMQNKTQTVLESKVNLITTEAPTPRHSVGMTYDSGQSRVILYGGKEYKGDLHVALSDFWSWDGDRWHKLQPQHTNE